MSLEYDGSQINDMPSLLFPSLIKLGLFNSCWVALPVALLLGYGYLMMIQMLCFYFMFPMF